VNDLREEHDENEYNLMCVNSDFLLNGLDESELGFENNINREFEDDKEL
jgi:hypothetical protein